NDRCQQSRRCLAIDRPRRPCIEDSRLNLAGGASAMTLPATLPEGAPPLVVVDDDRRIRDLLSRFLSSEGYRVTTADTATDARAKLSGLRLHLLLLAVMLPGESGFDLAKAIRGDSNVPILMLTARDAAESRIRGLEIGAGAHISEA